jgi:hypothetical protein
MKPAFLITSTALFCALAIATYASASATIEHKKKGDVHKYHVTAVLDVQGTTYTISNDESDRVSSVSPNGNYTLAETESNMKVASGGKSTNSNDPPEVNEHSYRSDGTYISPAHPTDKTRSELRAQNLQTIKLPAFSLAKGKEWFWDLASNKNTGAAKLHVAYKVLASERIAGMECWKISMSSHEVEGTAPASVRGFAWIRKSDALTVRMKVQVKNYPVIGMPAGVGGSVDQELVS